VDLPWIEQAAWNGGDLRGRRGGRGAGADEQNEQQDKTQHKRCSSWQHRSHPTSVPEVLPRRAKGRTDNRAPSVLPPLHAIISCSPALVGVGVISSASAPASSMLPIAPGPIIAPKLCRSDS